MARGKIGSHERLYLRNDLWWRGCLGDLIHRLESRDDTSLPFLKISLCVEFEERGEGYHGSVSSASTGRFAALLLPFTAVSELNRGALDGAGASTSISSS